MVVTVAMAALAATVAQKAMAQAAAHLVQVKLAVAATAVPVEMVVMQVMAVVAPVVTALPFTVPAQASVNCRATPSSFLKMQHLVAPHQVLMDQTDWWMTSTNEPKTGHKCRLLSAGRRQRNSKPL